MKTSDQPRRFVSARLLLGGGFCSGGFLLALATLAPTTWAQTNATGPPKPPVSAVQSYKHDTSEPLRDMVNWPGPDSKEEREAALNPRLPVHHIDQKDSVVQSGAWLKTLAPSVVPALILNFEGIGFPGINCNCLPPDTDGVVGSTQYVQLVNKGFQVFDKSTGESQLGPKALSSLWSGFGGACENGGAGDPVVLYDHLANRWVLTQFATADGSSITDQCFAVSTTSDATGTYHRYGYHLGGNFYDYPKLGVWPNGYYMAMNVFNAAGNAFLGPQPFAFDRKAMVAGNAVATMVTPGITNGPSEDTYLPADLDGSILPPAGSPNPYVAFPASGRYKLYHFHADFASPGKSTFTYVDNPLAAPFTVLCGGGGPCIPQPAGVPLASLSDRLMFRLAYRRFGDGHESLVGNYTVDAGSGVAGIRWFELRNVLALPSAVYQESTFQPDDTSRWMGSIAMDADGDIALGYSASSSTVAPSVRFTGRLASDPLNTLTRGEGTIIAGGGSQVHGSSRWGDYSDMTVDPVDDHTFWYTQEYYSETAEVAWRTRIASFKVQPPPPILIASGTSGIVAAGSNGEIDPAEKVTVSLDVGNFGSGGCTANLTGTLLATGGVTNPMPASQNYGAVCANGATAKRQFTFTVDPSVGCGAAVTAALVMKDGTTDYGTITFTILTGTPVIPLDRDFDALKAPTLPPGWTALNASGPAPGWVTSTDTPDSGSNDVFVDSPASISDKRLVTPGIAISTGSATVSFRNNYNLEGGFDGGILEVSSPNIRNGTFTDVTDPAVGGSFGTGGYTGTISHTFGNPLANRQAWTGNAGKYIDTLVKLGPNVAGQTIKLRFRLGSDKDTASKGWRLDGIVVNDGVICAGGSTPGYFYDAAVTGNTPSAIAGRKAFSVYTNNSPHTSATGNVVYAIPHDGSAPLKNAAQAAGKIVLVDRVPGLGATAARNCQNAGAIGVVDASDSGDPFLLDTNATALKVPMVVIPSDKAAAFKSAAGFDANGVSTSSPPSNASIAPANSATGNPQPAVDPASL